MEQPRPAEQPGFFDAERIHSLEAIVQSYTGVQDCSRENLQSIVAALRQESDSPEALSHEGNVGDGKEIDKSNASSSSLSDVSGELIPARLLDTAVVYMPSV